MRDSKLGPASTVRPAPPTSLVCIPYAGAGAGVFRSWRQPPSMSASTQGTVIVPVQLPGREELFLQPPWATLDPLVDECVAQVLAVADRGPFALFGHSFGALLAYETAVRLIERTGHRPVRLVVSGAPGPWLPRTRLGLSQTDDAEFVQKLKELIGYEHEALSDPELRELLLPMLRCDLSIADDYVPTSRVPLPIPITVLRGRDDVLVSSAPARSWAAVTAADFEYIEIPGGHMYFAEHAEHLLIELTTILSRTGRPETARS